MRSAMYASYLLTNTAHFGRSQLPWDENWQLDEKFFKDMEAWRERHPDSTLSKVMEKISDAVTRNLPFAEVVPDKPFPARGLVKALAHLLVLGVVRLFLFFTSCNITLSFLKRVARAKTEVFEFTWEVVTWLSTVETSLGKRKGTKVISIARDNLRHVRYVEFPRINSTG